MSEASVSENGRNGNGTGGSTEKLTIFDTSLRDGEQSPGVALDADDKLAIARQLAKLRVDVIEAGFPIASPGDFAAVRAVAEQIDGPTICGLARVWEKDIKRCAQALEPAAKGRIHVFVGTSPLHREKQLGLSKREVLERAVSMTALAKTFRDDIEFSPMDASRTEPGYLAEVVAGVIGAGATTINLPDTVGYATPDEWKASIEWLYGQVPELRNVVVSVHCHNDLGLAVANSLAAVSAGARQIEGCINGIGERAGNAAIEEIALATHLHPEVWGVHTDLDHSQLYRTSRLISERTGMLVQPNHPVVGANAFAHQSGIHQDGILKDRRTFEIIDAAAVGADSTLVLGKLSGRHALQARLAELGHNLEGDELQRAFERFKQLADTKQEVTDRDLEAIVGDEVQETHDRLHLEQLLVTTGTSSQPTATVRIRFADDTTSEAEATGDGPLDATFAAINAVVKVDTVLEEFAVQAITAGIDAIGRVSVRVRRGERLTVGHGADPDVIVASARAYLRALDKLSDEPQPRLTPENSGAGETATAATAATVR
jgi:2-isopropylmalate synthase